MASADSRVTIHMAASLDGFIARKDGSVDWLETADEFADGETMDPEFVAAFLETIDCYVMGSRTYETALGFEARGLGWSDYGRAVGKVALPPGRSRGGPRGAAGSGGIILADPASRASREPANERVEPAPTRRLHSNPPAGGPSLPSFRFA